MFGRNELFSKKVFGPLSRLGFFARFVSIIIICIVLIILPESALSQMLSTDAFTRQPQVFEVHQDTTTVRDTSEFTIVIDEDVVPYSEIEMTGSIYSRFYDGDPTSRTFGINPSLLLSIDTRNSSRYPIGEIVFFTDSTLQYEKENAAYSDNWYDMQWQVVLFLSKTPSESTVHRINMSLPYEQKTDDRLHENLSERITADTGPSGKPVELGASDIPITALPSEEHSKYSLYKESELQNGGNVKLPLYLPWLQNGTDRSGILPDTIYIGTDINYFNVADSLQSWKSGNETLQSDLNRLGSEWFDNRSGYIHFEWRIGK